jgi:hypothetical protein
MSGDLRDPGKSIGPGTLHAIATCYAVYVVLVALLGAAVEGPALSADLNIMQVGWRKTENCWVRGEEAMESDESPYLFLSEAGTEG